MRVLHDNYTSMQMKCRKCGSLLEVGPSDLQDDDLGGGFLVDCPLCKGMTRVPTRDVPKPILQRLDSAG